MLTEKAMLVAVHFSVWTARKHDKRVSEKVATEYNAETRAGRYNKKLLADAPKLDAINALVGRIRNWVYSVTLPWTDEGSRILPAELYYEFGRRWTEYESEFQQAVADFLRNYEVYVVEAGPVLGDLMCNDDYPTVEELREKFSMKRDILPIPTGNDFRVELNQAERDRLAKELDEANKQTMAAGICDLWQRLYDVVQHMARSLANNKRLHTSTIDNVRELADLLPLLNLAGDQTLADLAQRVKDELCQYSAETLRRDPTTRKEIANNAALMAESIAHEIGFSSGTPDAPAENVEADDSDADMSVPAGPVLVNATAHDVEMQAENIMARMLPFMNMEIARTA